jgi:hypothetical protein
MNRLWISLVTFLFPLIAIAQEAAADAEGPVETPWGALIGFLVLTVVATVWTVWAIMRKKEDEDK